MHDDFPCLGPRPRLQRALVWASLLWGLSLLLPARAGAGGAVWSPELWLSSTGRVAVLCSAATALTLAIIGLAPGRRHAPFRASLAITASAVGLAGVLADTDAQLNLLPYMPSALSRGYVALVVSLGAAAAGLRLQQAGRAAALMTAAALAGVFLYVWPHPFGTLAQHTLTHVAVVLRSSPSPALGASATQVFIAMFPGLLLSLGIFTRLRARAPTRRLVAGWLIAAVPATLVALGVKSAALTGADHHMLIGLRAACIFAALVLTLTVGGLALVPRDEQPLRLRLRVLAHASTLTALALALSPHVHTPEHQAWRLGPSPSWAEQLYASTIPRLVISAANVDLPGGQAQLQAVMHEAQASAQTEPELSQAVADLGRWAQSPGRHHRRLQHAAERINDLARQEDLPFYLDLQLSQRRHEAGHISWQVWVKTYRIEQVHRFKVQGQARSTLWLRRMDSTNLGDGQLGWTRHDAPEGMVMLNVVQDHWVQDLAPALAGIGGRDPRTRTYARHARALNADLVHALKNRVSRDELGRLLECTRRGQLRRPSCAALQHKVQPEVVRVLAEKVETHELRHAADGARLQPPAELLRAMSGYSEQSMHFASAELSAYLAEIAHSRVPRLALAHFLALSQAHPKSPEGFAGRVAFSTLEQQTGLSAHALLSRPASQVAAAAAKAHGQLFGAVLSLPIALDPPSWPNSAPADQSV